MKNVKIMLIILATIILFFIGTTKINATTQTVLPETENGKITLNDDVSLASSFVVQENETLTIDLNGHTITGPIDGYAIENKGNLTIIDSTKKGKITSALYNCGTLEVNNITLENTNKNVIEADAKDEDSETTINNSKIISGSGTTYSIRSQRPTNTKLKKIINICNSEISGKMNMNYSYNEINVDGTIKLDGKAISRDFLKYMKQKNTGTKIILTTDASNKDLVVPDGATLIIPEGVTFTQGKSYKLSGDIIVNGKLEGSKYYNETMKSYHPNFSKVISYSSTEKNDRIKLIADVTETSRMAVSGDRILSLNLNGHTITTSNIQATSGAKLTITDTSKDKAGKINGNVKINGSNANITIKGGTITGQVSVEADEGATMVIEDGIIKGSVTNNTSLTIKNGTFSSIPVTEGEGVTTLLGGTYPLGEFTGATIPEEMIVIKNSETQTIINGTDPADYTKLNQLIQRVNDMDLTAYTDETAKNLTDIINGIDHTLTIVNQAKVDGYVTSIEKAINDLVVKPGEIIIGTKGDSKVPTISINNNSEDLKSLLTQEEIAQLNNGEHGEIYLQMKDIENQLSEAEKKLIKEKGQATGYKYIDLSLFKKIGTNNAIKITNPNQKISITIEIPKDIINVDQNINRSYYIVRLHDGQAEIINGTFDNEENKFTFETDRFSIYALAYIDTIIEENKPEDSDKGEEQQGGQEQDKENNENNQLQEDTSNPATGDSIINIVIVLITASLILFVISKIKSQKKYKSKH